MHWAIGVRGVCELGWGICGYEVGRGMKNGA